LSKACNDTWLPWFKNESKWTRIAFVMQNHRLGMRSQEY
jgi:hypothetical protein